jgi:hypothetical protein
LHYVLFPFLAKYLPPLWSLESSQSKSQQTGKKKKKQSELYLIMVDLKSWIPTKIIGAERTQSHGS